MVIMTGQAEENLGLLLRLRRIDILNASTTTEIPMMIVTLAKEQIKLAICQALGHYQFIDLQ
tara:strand:- start:47 stop:232 length:186 start_codon:yes stop_codon:yes gene_type:complete